MRIPIFYNKPFLYAFRTLLGCFIVWSSLDLFHDKIKIWALISVIVVTDPDFDTVRVSAISRIINTILGCVIGLSFMYIAGINFWSLMAGIAVSVFISTSFKNYPASWKLAPATVAIIIIPAITGNEDWKAAMQIAITRTGEILYGCLVAFILGLVLTGIRKRLEMRNKLSDPAQSISTSPDKVNEMQDRLLK